MSKFLSLVFILSLLSCDTAKKTKEVPIMKDEYTQSWVGTTLHIYFKGNTAYVPPNGESIEPEHFVDSYEFISWYRNYHYHNYFIPRQNYWLLSNTMDTSYVYYFHIKGKFTDVDYQIKWRDGQFVIFHSPRDWRRYL